MVSSTGNSLPVGAQGRELDSPLEDGSFAGRKVPVHALPMSVAEAGGTMSWSIAWPKASLGDNRMCRSAAGFHSMTFPSGSMTMMQSRAVLRTAAFNASLARSSSLRPFPAEEVTDCRPAALMPGNAPGRGRHPAAEELDHSQHFRPARMGMNRADRRPWATTTSALWKSGLVGDLRTPEGLAGRPHLSRQALALGEPPVIGRGPVIGRFDVGCAPEVTDRSDSLAGSTTQTHPSFQSRASPIDRNNSGTASPNVGGAGQHLADRVLDGQSPVVLFPLRDVPEGHERPATPPLVENGGRGVLDRHGGAVRPPEHLVFPLAVTGRRARAGDG